MNALEMRLQYFTDLTPGRLRYLEQAEAGTLRTMNGATAIAMRELIGPKSEGFPITEYGREVLGRARRVMAGEELYERKDFYYTVSMARQAEKRYPGFNAAMVKMMIGLHNCPGQTWGWLAHVYGGRVVAECIRMGGVRGENRFGCQCFLTELGERVVNVENEKD